MFEAQTWTGAAAVDMARRGGREGGPGFEPWCIQDMREQSGHDVSCIELRREHSSVHPNAKQMPTDSVMWRVFVRGQCTELRFTARPK
jgi:hypothetical protein